MNKKGFHWLYVWSVLYIIIVYTFPFIYDIWVDEIEEDSLLAVWPLGLPLLFGIINAIIAIAGHNKIDRLYFLNCSVMIKYALMPFFCLVVFVSLWRQYLPLYRCRL